MPTVIDPNDPATIRDFIAKARSFASLSAELATDARALSTDTERDVHAASGVIIRYRQKLDTIAELATLLRDQSRALEQARVVAGLVKP